MTTIIALIVAAMSIVVNLVQWMSRHRPYLGIVDLDWYRFSEDIPVPDSIRCKIRNMGEAPAKAIYFEGKISFYSGEKITKRDLGVLFPDQEMEVFLGLDLSDSGKVDYLMSGSGVTEVSSRVEYKGPLSLHPRKPHKTEQNFLIMREPHTWVTLPGGTCS